MKAAKTRILGGAAILAAANLASSAGAQLPPPATYDRPGSAMQSGPPPGHYRTPLADKIYLGFDLGAAFQQDITISDTVGDRERVSFDPGVRLDFELGYNFTRNWAAEFEMGFIVNHVNHSVALGTDYNNVDFLESPVMMNVLYRLPLHGPLAVYFGGGVGGVVSDYEYAIGDFGYYQTQTDVTFGYQAVAGIKYAINHRWEVGIAYKFLGTGGHDLGPGVAFDGFTPTAYKSDGTMTHSILATITWNY